jgi:2-polyprenyl-3-methyl-5-hydroxy-6-metoxy-1,4-benzoquinol methylase
MKRESAPREAKALKIRKSLLDFLGQHARDGMSCLDIGCGTGEITSSLADLFAKTVGLDRDVDSVVGRHHHSPGPHLLQADGVHLPFRDASFDVVICAQVYEHVASAERLPAEVERVLEPGGLCFFSGPNKVWPIEPHYGLPFLHWLPGRLADRYLRATGRGEAFEIHSYTVWRLRRLWRRFARHDYTIKMLREPERFGLSMPVFRYIRWLPAFVWRVLYDLLPNYNWILVKPDA